jgi:hypothetical protein
MEFFLKIFFRVLFIYIFINFVLYIYFELYNFIGGAKNTTLLTIIAKFTLVLVKYFTYPLLYKYTIRFVSFFYLYSL